MQSLNMQQIISQYSELMLDKNKIKVIDGIAGAGKSSALHKFLIDNKITYLRTTSTNKLRRDAMSRFPECRCTTTCSGLFNNDRKQGGYYTSPKEEIPEDTIVIDEILQTSTKVLDWCLENVGKKNIIITTDSHQMLAVGQSYYLLNKYREFIQNKNVDYFEVMTTLRARDERTKEIFYELYQEVDNE